MHLQPLPGHDGATIELDLCFQCQGMWIDPQENLKLAPAGVAQLFKLLHDKRTEAHQPLAVNVDCPRCSGPLTRGFDVVRSGRYITNRCGRGHGRFSAFSSFMIEKGFVRQLTRHEIADIAKQVAVIHCSSCGAPVDLRTDHACAHCRSALSLLDPTAVERALQGYAKAAQPAGKTQQTHDVADALMRLERDRQRTPALAQAARQERSTDVDLWTIGLALVAAVLS